MDFLIIPNSFLENNDFEILENSILENSHLNEVERRTITVYERIKKLFSYGYLYCKYIKYRKKIPATGNEEYFKLLKLKGENLYGAE